jgi:hypothetical protein
MYQTLTKTFSTIAGIALVMAIATPAWAETGCTPGYWKNHPDAWPSSTFECVVEGVGVFTHEYGHDLGLPDLYNTAYLVDPMLTQGETLDLQGGPSAEGAARVLLRAAVAAVLNAGHPDVDYSVPACGVIASVNAVLASQDREAIEGLKDAFDALNDEDCPL